MELVVRKEVVAALEVRLKALKALKALVARAAHVARVAQAAVVVVVQVEVAQPGLADVKQNEKLLLRIPLICRRTGQGFAQAQRTRKRRAYAI